ncbi:tRNA (adenosine(37)-N6)-threonylcarbamoyltransferase complex ATPase subunit type 1 TsaE [Patescibacteria group bacterium]
MKQISNSPEQTKQIASDLALCLKGGEVVLLEGELGAGKTTFTQGFAEALGVVDPVRSPTFTIMNIYKTDRSDIKEIIHLDFYRLQESSVHLEDLGLDEWLGRDDVVIIAEWPPEGLDLLGINKVIVISLEVISEKDRSISIENS